MTLLRTNKGFSLVMALVAIGILGAVALGIATLFSSIGAKSRHMNSVAGARALISTLQGFISYPSLCISNLDPTSRYFNPTQAATPNGMAMSFRLGGGATGSKVQAGSTILSYDVTVDYLSYRNVSMVGADPLIAGNRLYSGELALKLRKSGAGPSLGGSELRERGVGTLVVSVNPATNVVGGCYALADARQACNEVGGVYDDFSSPKCKLPYPCAGIPNSMFLGYNSNGDPQCKTMGQIVGGLCPQGQFLTSDGAGGVRCQAP